MKKLTLNEIQLQHQRFPCAGKKCALQGCTNCLCSKRVDAEFCCDEHKSLKNNNETKEQDYQVNYRKNENKKNTKIVEGLYDRGYRQLDFQALKIAGFNFEVAPIGGLTKGRKVALYGTIALWVDADRIIQLEKL